MAADEVFVGDVFDTDYELGCVVTTTPDNEGNFDALDSEGIECAFNLAMILRVHPGSAEQPGAKDAEVEDAFAAGYAAAVDDARVIAMSPYGGER